MRKIAKYEEFEQVRINLSPRIKMRKIVKYEDFEKARLEMCPAEKKLEKWSI